MTEEDLQFALSQQAEALTKWRKTNRKMMEETIAKELGYTEFCSEWGREHLIQSNPKYNNDSYFFDSISQQLWNKLVAARMKLVEVTIETKTNA